MKSQNDRVVISGVGAGNADKELMTLAFEVGAEVARRGGTIVCGGLGGVMEGVCKGATSEGGLTVGIIPGSGRQEANKYVKIIIPSGLGHARNVLVVQSGMVVIALPGETGTLSEIAIALKSGRPVVGVDAWGDIEGVVCEPDPKSAVERAFELIWMSP